MTATQRVTRCSTRKFSWESPGSVENLCRQTCAHAVSAAFLYGHPENCPMSRIRTRYSLTCSSRSSAARANPLISRVFCTQSHLSRHAVPSLRRSRYSSTRHTAGCWPCHPMPWLLWCAPAPLGTLFMGLGKLHPNWYRRPVYFRHIPGNPRDLSRARLSGWSTSGDAFPKDSPFFPRCACADRTMGDGRLVHRSHRSALATELCGTMGAGAWRLNRLRAGPDQTTKLRPPSTDGDRRGKSVGPGRKEGREG